MRNLRFAFRNILKLKFVSLILIAFFIVLSLIWLLATDSLLDSINSMKAYPFVESKVFKTDLIREREGELSDHFRKEYMGFLSQNGISFKKSNSLSARYHRDVFFVFGNLDFINQKRQLSQFTFDKAVAICLDSLDNSRFCVLEENDCVPQISASTRPFEKLLGFSLGPNMSEFAAEQSYEKENKKLAPVYIVSDHFPERWYLLFSNSSFEEIIFESFVYFESENLRRSYADIFQREGFQIKLREVCRTSYELTFLATYLYPFLVFSIIFTTISLQWILSSMVKIFLKRSCVHFLVGASPTDLLIQIVAPMYMLIFPSLIVRTYILWISSSPYTIWSYLVLFLFIDIVVVAVLAILAKHRIQTELLDNIYRGANL